LVTDTGLLFVITFWICLFFINLLLKSSQRYGFLYTETLVSFGVTFSLCQIRWQTSLFNKLFSKIGRYNPKLSLLWFTLGAVFAVISMVSSVVILTLMLYRSVKDTKADKLLQPVMPGMNLPWNQVAYYLITLIISGTFHEVGHAIAAVRENVRVLSFGVFVLFMYPGAFVELHTDQLDIITPFRRLRIFSAGVWHNFILAVVAYILSTSLPMWLSPLYTMGDGVLVTHVAQQSSIVNRLPIGDVITYINNCPVRKTEEWYLCLQKIQTNPVDGYCGPSSYTKTHNTSLPTLVENFGEPDCCNDTSAYRFCFWYKRHPKAMSLSQKLFNANILVRTSLEYNSKFTEHACLPARHILSGRMCKTNLDCALKNATEFSLCHIPLTKNTTRVIRIGHKKGQEVLFVGEPRELSSTVMLSDYIPIYNTPFLNLPKHIESMCLYLISISAALALLNMVPCFYLDGHHTLEILLEILLPHQHKLRLQIQTVILMLGSSLLLVNVLIALSTLF